MIGAMPRATHSRPLRRVAALGGVVLLVVAAVAGGLVLGRDTAPAAQRSPVVHYTQSPYWTLAGHTFKGVYQGERITAFLPQGLPFGWPHSRQGAVAAATEILKVSMSPVVFGAPLIFSNAYGGTPLQGQELATWAAVVPNGRDVIQSAERSRAYPQMAGWPLAYRVDSATPDDVVVEIWATQVFSLPNQIPFSEHWFTERMTLQWSGEGPSEVAAHLAAQSDWQIRDAVMTDGPVPYDASAQQGGGETPPAQLGWTSYGSN